MALKFPKLDLGKPFFPPLPAEPAPHEGEPPPKPAVREDSPRLVRIETRLVRLMAHMGLDSDGFPLKSTQDKS